MPYSINKDIVALALKPVKADVRKALLNEACYNAETGTGELLADLSASGRVRPWNELKKQNLRMAVLFGLARNYAGDGAISEDGLIRLRDCASLLFFGLLEDGGMKLVRASFCKNKLCPICNWRKGMKLYSQVTDITNAIAASGMKVRYIFLTLTIRNCGGEQLRETLDKMNKGFAYVTAKSKTFASAKLLKQNLLGYYKAVEITCHVEKGRNDFHPHIHAVLAVKPQYFGRGYLKQAEWRELWKAALGVDYLPQVDVRTINMSAKDIAEVAKYPLKSSDLLKAEDEDKAARALAVLAPAIRGRRFVSYGGIFRDYKKLLRLDDVETGDLVNTDGDGEDVKLNFVTVKLYQYHVRMGCYIC